MILKMCQRKKRMKDLKRHFTGDKRMSNKHMKGCSTSFSHQKKKYKLNPQCDRTIYPLKWLKLKRLAIPQAGNDAEQLDRSSVAGGKCNMVQFWKQFGSFL